MLNGIVTQVIFWVFQLVAGIIASGFLLGQLTKEAREDNRQSDEFKYASPGLVFIIGLLLGGLTALGALPGFLWGGGWVYLTLAPMVLAVIFQLAAKANRAQPLIVTVLASGIDGAVLAGGAIIPFKLPTTTIIILVAMLVVSVGLIFLGYFAEESEGKEVD